MMNNLLPIYPGKNICSLSIQFSRFPPYLFQFPTACLLHYVLCFLCYQLSSIVLDLANIALNCRQLPTMAHSYRAAFVRI